MSPFPTPEWVTCSPTDRPQTVTRGVGGPVDVPLCSDPDLRNGGRVPVGWGGSERRPRGACEVERPRSRACRRNAPRLGPTMSGPT